MAVAYLETQPKHESRFGNRPLMLDVINFAAFEIVRFDSQNPSLSPLSLDTREIAESAALLAASQYGSDATFADVFQEVKPSLYIIPRVLNDAEELEKVTRTNPGLTADFLVAANLFGDTDEIQRIVHAITPDSQESISPEEIKNAVAFRRMLLAGEQGLVATTNYMEHPLPFTTEKESADESGTKDPNEIARIMIEDISTFNITFPTPRETVLRFFPELGTVIDKNELKQRGKNGRIELTQRQFQEAMIASRFRGIQQKTAKKAIEDELFRMRKKKGGESNDS